MRCISPLSPPPRQDAAWILAGQDLKCQTPADVYLLLKSSDFISHDLDHAFADCVDGFEPDATSASASLERVTDDVAAINLATEAEVPRSGADDPEPRAPSSAPGTASTRTRRPYEFELVLKKWFDMPKSQEWRCFVRQDRLLGSFCPTLLFLSHSLSFSPHHPWSSARLCGTEDRSHGKT